MTKAKERWERAQANIGGVGLACFLTMAEQEREFDKAWIYLGKAAQDYVHELENEIKRLKSDIARQREYVDQQ